RFTFPAVTPGRHSSASVNKKAPATASSATPARYISLGMVATSVRSPRPWRGGQVGGSAQTLHPLYSWRPSTRARAVTGPVSPGASTFARLGGRAFASAAVCLRGRRRAPRDHRPGQQPADRMGIAPEGVNGRVDLLARLQAAERRLIDPRAFGDVRQAQ